MLAVEVSESAEALSTVDVVVADVDAAVDDDDDEVDEEDTDVVTDTDALREVLALVFEETDSVLACFRVLVVGSGLNRFFVPAGSGLALLDDVVEALFDASTVTASAERKKVGGQEWELFVVVLETIATRSRNNMGVPTTVK